MSDIELGAFLRTRREAITPAEVGLPKSARRRTPGLRRAELATLAGVSVEYLTRLEQGRDRHPSAQVLVALADALRLSPDEGILPRRQGGRRRHLPGGRAARPLGAPHRAGAARPVDRGCQVLLRDQTRPRAKSSGGRRSPCRWFVVGVRVGRRPAQEEKESVP